MFYLFIYFYNVFKHDTSYYMQNIFLISILLRMMESNTKATLSAKTWVFCIFPPLCLRYQSSYLNLSKKANIFQIVHLSCYSFNNCLLYFSKVEYLIAGYPTSHLQALSLIFCYLVFNLTTDFNPFISCAKANFFFFPTTLLVVRGDRGLILQTVRRALSESGTYWVLSDTGERRDSHTIVGMRRHIFKCVRERVRCAVY